MYENKRSNQATQMAAVQFIESLDRTTLTISDEEFEQNVEAAVSAIAEKHAAQSPPVLQTSQFSSQREPERSRSSNAALLASQTTFHAGQGGPGRSSIEEDGGRENPAISGLLKTIQKPLSTIGRIFSDDDSLPLASQGSQPHNPSSTQPQHQRGRSTGGLPAPPLADPIIRADGVDDTSIGKVPSKHTLPAEEAAARQASAETAEAQRLQRAEHANVVETLAGMFPDLDKDIISDVVHQKEGR